MSKTNRTWGTYEVLLEDDNIKVKKIVLFPSHALSLQRHEDRDEYWTITKDTGLSFSESNKKTIDEGGKKHKSYLISVGDIVLNRVGDWHSISNISNTENLEFIEIQTGVCNENDIERFVE
jgi:mannose-6-phosphate isomerase-like protein (cupin superfamily)